MKKRFLLSAAAAVCAATLSGCSLFSFLQNSEPRKNLLPQQSFSAEELAAIFDGQMRRNEYVCSPETRDEIARRMAAARAGANVKEFGNARFVRNAFERTLERQAVRLASSGSTDRASLLEIRTEDLAI